jgi:hypothetical protein
MIRRNKLLVMAAMMGCAAYANAGTAIISPALEACSKALVESLAKSDSLPTYSIKAPSSPVSSLVDPYSFTVLAHSKKTNELLAKASCKATPDGAIVTFKSIPLKS